MAKRRKLKKQVYYVLVAIIVLVIILAIGINKYQEYKYHQTYEYKLLEHGYNIEDVKIILDNFKDNNDLDFFLNNEVNENYLSILKEKYYLSKNFYKYIEYGAKNKKMDLTTIVRNINIHRDIPFYEEEFPTNTKLDTALLVNKYYYLDSSYAPDDLASFSLSYAWGDAGSIKIRQVAYDAFMELWNAAYEEKGYYFMVTSGYRTHEEQETVYNKYKNSRGTTYADSIAARPGHSEHQTGLALDISSKAHPSTASFKESEEAAWLKENAHRFGFILRYPEGYQNITGFEYEAWHYRYVGKEIATYIYENNISFEEYYAYFLEK